MKTKKEGYNTEKVRERQKKVIFNQKSLVPWTRFQIIDRTVLFRWFCFAFPPFHSIGTPASVPFFSAGHSVVPLACGLSLALEHLF